MLKYVPENMLDVPCHCCFFISETQLLLPVKFGWHSVSIFPSCLCGDGILCAQQGCYLSDVMSMRMRSRAGMAAGLEVGGQAMATMQ